MFNIKFLKKIIFYIALSFIVNYNQLLADTQKFDIWLNKFKLIALELPLVKIIFLFLR